MSHAWRPRRDLRPRRVHNNNIFQFRGGNPSAPGGPRGGVVVGGRGGVGWGGVRARAWRRAAVDLLNFEVLKLSKL